MEYFLVFLEGIASFISPCMLPMLPIYMSYFAGNKQELKKTVINSTSFVLGFSIVFIAFSIVASLLGSFISESIKYIKIIFGIIIILLGLNYMEILKFNIFKTKIKNKINTGNMNFITSFLFGVFFSISWTPCIGTFLSSALLLIARKQQIIKGIILMIMYLIGLGIPFILSSVFINKLQEVFLVIKRNYSKVKFVSGVILIIMGIYLIFF